jgi:hypothetical protein
MLVNEFSTLPKYVNLNKREALNMVACGLAKYFRYKSTEHCIEVTTGNNLTRWENDHVYIASVSMHEFSGYMQEGWKLTNSLKER